MFTIERTKVGGSVVDEARDVRLRSLRTAFYGTTEWLLMEWGGRTIPIDTVVEKVQEPSHTVTRTINAIGDHINWAIVEPADRVAPYEFTDDAERRQALMLAVEALVVYGSFYNGLEYDGSPPANNWIRVRIKGEPGEYTLDSFGYRDAGDNHDQ